MSKVNKSSSKAPLKDFPSFCSPYCFGIAEERRSLECASKGYINEKVQPRLIYFLWEYCSTSLVYLFTFERNTISLAGQLF